MRTVAANARIAETMVAEVGEMDREPDHHLVAHTKTKIAGNKSAVA